MSESEMPSVDELLARMKSHTPMTLEEAKRRQAEFMERYGNELVRRVNADAPNMPEKLVVSREEFEAIEAVFQHWPLCDEEGEYVGHACFCDPSVAYQHVLFKGIPVTY